jgi:diguanylate cyclase (GGDEF)-like protein/PAS domain S-box-containing protein
MSKRAPRPGRARLRLPAPAAVLTLLAGLSATAVMVSGMVVAERERARAVFVRLTEVRGAAVERSFANAVDVLRAANALFVAVGTVTREQFGLFTRPLLVNHGYIRAVDYHRIVEDAARDAYEAEARGLRPGFTITERRGDALVPAGRRPRYLPVHYIEPMEGNERALGFDAFSYGREAPALRAIDTGLPSSSLIVPLIRQGARPGLVLTLPVYRTGAALPDVAARRAQAVGDTSVVLDVTALMVDSLGIGDLLNRPGVQVELHGPTGSGMAPIFRHDALARHSQPAPYRWLGDDTFASRRTFDFAGRRWELRIRGVASELGSGIGPLVTLALGLLATFAAGAYAQARAVRTRRIEGLVERRTADLNGALDALRLYRRAIDASANAVILVSATRPGYPIEYVNPAFERMRGYAAADTVGHGLYELGEREPDQAGVAELRAAIAARREGHVTMRLRCGGAKRGQEIDAEVYIAPVNNAAGDTEHFVMTQYDITTAKRYEAELEAHARFDTLTGLANRSVLQDRIDSAINYAAGQQPVWVVALDLDHFKFVNDTLGRATGDRLLQAAGARIACAVGRSDTVARTGGDEFVLVLPGRASQAEASATIDAVRAALAHPMELEGQQLVLTTSAGVAAYPADGSDAATLVQHAEIAMYRAKELGRDAVQFYAPVMNLRASERIALEGALRGALLHDEFELHYQPQVALDTGAVVGVEALIRWRHPRLGLVRPDRFIALAEETGLIVPIGAWVLRTACRQNRAWQHAGYGPLRIGVNLSARQFAEPGLVHDIARTLEETGLSPGSLEIEITESLVMEDVEGAIRTMVELKQMGVKLSIDDFGTGYSSLSYLRRFPVDVLKIDRSFVRDIAVNADDAAMVAAIIELARGLHMRTIAEGVETEAQLDYLRLRGCDEVQGHVYAQAEPCAAVEAMLRKGRHMEPQRAPA